MPKVTQLRAYRNREVVETLREMLALAEAGEIDGHCFVIKIGNVHKAGTTGCYHREGAEALRATFALEKHLRAPLGLLPDSSVM